MNNGPIKIKKLIPTKQSFNNQNKQSMQSMFTGRAHMARITNDNTTNFSDNEDDIERDTATANAAAEIIKPKTFRRVSSHQKIKIKISNQKNKLNNLTKLHSDRQAFNPAAFSQQMDFEEKVKTQIDHKFIDNLIQNTQSQGKILNSSRWSNIATSFKRHPPAMVDEGQPMPAQSVT